LKFLKFSSRSSSFTLFLSRYSSWWRFMSSKLNSLFFLCSYSFFFTSSDSSYFSFRKLSSSLSKSFWLFFNSLIFYLCALSISYRCLFRCSI
jgi:hypothetical protein